RRDRRVLRCDGLLRQHRGGGRRNNQSLKEASSFHGVSKTCGIIISLRLCYCLQMKTTRFSNILLAFAFAALPAIAKPNFTGDWKVNLSKSTFGQMPAPNSMTSKIAHDEPKLKVSNKQSSDRGDFAADFDYTTDGKECTNQI